MHNTNDEWSRVFRKRWPAGYHCNRVRPDRKHWYLWYIPHTVYDVHAMFIRLYDHPWSRPPSINYCNYPAPCLPTVQRAARECRRYRCSLPSTGSKRFFFFFFERQLGAIILYTCSLSPQRYYYFAFYVFKREKYISCASRVRYRVCSVWCACC